MNFYTFSFNSSVLELCKYYDFNDVTFCKIYVKQNLSTLFGNFEFKSVLICGLTTTKAEWVYHNWQENLEFDLIRDFVMSTHG